YVYFFFSSRRRHTRSKRDWSSDVCSSDLLSTGHRSRCAARSGERLIVLHTLTDAQLKDCLEKFAACDLPALWKPRANQFFKVEEIGRASCRERVKMWGGEGGVNGKKEE